jgi:O-antigen/teichoic acid export membrane protein
MISLANRAALLTLSRLANYGLMLISPIVLVRLLSVAQFGHYRKFLLYASLLQAFATFSTHDSLLYFVPASAASPWRVVRQTALFTLVSSVTMVALFVVADTVSGGALAGEYLLPLSVHTLLFVNLDFWEFFLLASHRPVAMLTYTATRLAARMLVAIGAAILTRDVATIIWSLVGIEAARLIVSGIAWRMLDRSGQEPQLSPSAWRDRLRFCTPSGLAVLLWMTGRNLSDLAVANVLGAGRFAQYSVGRYADPIIVTVRNSISSVILPEMVQQERLSKKNPLVLWQRATVINSVLLLPMAVLLVVFAEPLITAVFGPEYRDAAPVMRIYALVLVRECCDFGPALRALNRTDPLIHSSLVGLLISGVALFLLLPVAGIAGAMLAVVCATFAEGTYLGWRVKRLYQVRLRDLLPWRSVGKTALAAALASPVLAGSAWTDVFGFAGIILASCLYLLVFAAIVSVSRIPEALVMFNWSKRIIRAIS